MNDIEMALWDAPMADGLTRCAPVIQSVNNPRQYETALADGFTEATQEDLDRHEIYWNAYHDWIEERNDRAGAHRFAASAVQLMLAAHYPDSPLNPNENA